MGLVCSYRGDYFAMAELALGAVSVLVALSGELNRREVSVHDIKALRDEIFSLRKDFDSLEGLSRPGWKDPLRSRNKESLGQARAFMSILRSTLPTVADIRRNSGARSRRVLGRSTNLRDRVDKVGQRCRDTRCDLLECIVDTLKDNEERALENLPHIHLLVESDRRCPSDDPIGINDRWEALDENFDLEALSPADVIDRLNQELRRLKSQKFRSASVLQPKPASNEAHYLDFSRIKKSIRTCHILILLGILIVAVSLIPAILRSNHKDIPGGFAIAQYIVNVGMFAVGCAVAIHVKRCTCWSTTPRDSQNIELEERLA